MDSTNTILDHCSLCIEKFARHPVLKLSCKHLFHNHCLNNYFDISHYYINGKKVINCPYCRIIQFRINYDTFIDENDNFSCEHYFKNSENFIKIDNSYFPNKILPLGWDARTILKGELFYNIYRNSEVSEKDIANPDDLDDLLIVKKTHKRINSCL